MKTRPRQSPSTSLEEIDEETSEQQGNAVELPVADDHSTVLYFKHPTNVRMRNREAQVTSAECFGAGCKGPGYCLGIETACLAACDSAH